MIHTPECFVPYKVLVMGSWFATFVLGDKIYTHPFQALETKLQKPGDVDRILEKNEQKSMELLTVQVLELSIQ